MWLLNGFVRHIRFIESLERGRETGRVGAMEALRMTAIGGSVDLRKSVFFTNFAAVSDTQSFYSE